MDLVRHVQIVSKSQIALTGFDFHESCKWIMLFYVGVAGYPQVLKKYQIVNISRLFFQLF